MKQFLTYVNGAPFQPAVAAALGRRRTQLTAALPAPAAARSATCCAAAWPSSAGTSSRPQATYFATVDVGRDGVEFCRELPGDAGVVAIPSSVFYDTAAGDQLVRFAFCKRPEVLADALRPAERRATA